MADATKIMERLGFPTGEDGPYAAELRKLIERKVSEGMTSMHVSRGSKGTNEAIARELLAMEWALSRGHSAPLRIDGLWTRRLDLRTGKRSISVHWVWFADLAQRRLMRFHILKDRARGVRNPYDASNAL